MSLLDATCPAPPFSEVCDIWPREIEQGRIVFEACPSLRFYNPMGTVHGGWITTVLDSASMLKPGQVYTTAELKVNFVRPLLERTVKVWCEAKIVHCGRRLATSEGRLTTVLNGTKQWIAVTWPN